MKHETEEERWAYNVEDCIRTREVGETIAATIKNLGLEAHEQFQQGMFYPVLKAMLRGCRVDLAARQRLASEVEEQLQIRREFIKSVAGHDLNPNSPNQLVKFFYDDLGCTPIKTRAKKGIPGHLTVNDEALVTIAAREPLLKPIIDAIGDIRTLRIFLSNYIEAKLDYDMRLRCSYNICGTLTYRLASSKSAFDSGCNFQNIPSDKSKSLGKAAKRDTFEFQYPNIRCMIIPDPGYTFFDLDLDRADLQVVVWEADDAMLKSALRLGVDIHLLNCYAINGKEPPPLEELVESHPRYSFHRGPLKLQREFAKVFCHATNYVGSARTVASHTGRLVHEIDRAQKQWFSAHPGIKRWHERIAEQISKRRFIENRFGQRWYIFDRLDAVLPEAVAWIPQSTVGRIINTIWRNFYDNLPQVEVLLQVHDSLGGQFPTHLKDQCLEQMLPLTRVVVPYEDPLIIPAGIATSSVSWGDCH